MEIKTEKFCPNCGRPEDQCVSGGRCERDMAGRLVTTFHRDYTVIPKVTLDIPMPQGATSIPLAQLRLTLLRNHLDKCLTREHGAEKHYLAAKHDFDEAHAITSRARDTYMAELEAYAKQK